MTTKNALTARTASGLASLKRASSLIRLTQSILGTPVPARNRTDKQGRWTEHNALFEGDVHEGTYVDDKRHGPWVLRDGGLVIECTHVDDKLHGRWVVREANGDVFESCYENGEVVEC